MAAKTPASDESVLDAKLTRHIREAAMLPCSVLRFVGRMRRQFGSYVSTAMLSYGVNQGTQIQMFSMAAQMYFMDTLGVDGATMGRILTIGRMPWSAKPLFGLISDVFPIFGLRRNPYMVIGGLLGLVGALGPGLLAPSATGFLPFMLAGALSTAWPDVVVDATTAELAKEYPEHASDFQSLCWGTGSVGSFIGAALSGILVMQLRPRGLMCLCSLAAFSVLIPGLLRRLPEKPVLRGMRKSKLSWFRKHAGLSFLALLLCACCVGLSLMQLYLPTPGGRAAVTLGCAVVLAISVCIILGRIATVLAKVAVFIFLRECMMPQVNDAMVQWQKNAEDGPRFSPMLLGWSVCATSLAFFFAVVIFNRYLTKCNYRKIFAVAQVCMMITSSMDIVLVKRWNLKFGIPDEVMLFGDAATQEAFRSFFVMSVNVLASKVCPGEVEATLFALLMSLVQFGSNIGTLFGSSLLEFMGCVNGNWDDFHLVVAIKSLTRVLPVFMIPLLVPSLTPEDPIFDDWSQRKDSEKGLAAADAGGQAAVEDNLEVRVPAAEEVNPAVRVLAAEEVNPEVRKPAAEEVNPEGRVLAEEAISEKETAPSLGDDSPEEGQIVDLEAGGRPTAILGTAGEHWGEAVGQEKPEEPAVLSV